MVRTLTAVGASLAALAVTSPALAQSHSTFGQEGELIVGADRLFPLFAYTHTSQDQFTGAGDPKVVGFDNQTSISLLWGSATATGLAGNGPQDTFYTLPRVGVDYVIAPKVTIGGELILYFTLGGSSGTNTTTNGTTTSTSAGNPSALAFGLAPRAGYLVPITDLFSLWLRGGFSYYIASSKTTVTTGNNMSESQTNSANQFALDLDPTLVFTPIPHIGVTASVTADLPITGGHATENDAMGTSTTQSAFSSVLFFGVTVGMITYF